MAEQLTQRNRLAYSIKSMSETSHIEDEGRPEASTHQPTQSEAQQHAQHGAESSRVTQREVQEGRKRILKKLLADKVSDDEFNKIHEATKDWAVDDWKGLKSLLEDKKNSNIVIDFVKNIFTSHQEDKVVKETVAKARKDEDAVVVESPVSSSDGAGNESRGNGNGSGSNGGDGGNRGGNTHKKDEEEDKHLQELKGIRIATEKTAVTVEQMLAELKKMGVSQERMEKLMRENADSLKIIKNLYEGMVYAQKDHNDLLREAEIELQQNPPSHEDEMDRIKGKISEVQDLSGALDLLSPSGPLYKQIGATEIDYVRTFKNEPKTIGGNPYTGEDRNYAFERVNYEINQLRNHVEGMFANGRPIDEVREYLLNALNTNEEKAMQILAERARSGERGRQSVDNIQELGQFIMALHPNFAEGGDHPIIENGVFNQGNFIKWIQDQLMYYHNQDPDAPSINFFQQITVDSPTFLRPVSVAAMIGNPGVYFKLPDGTRLDALKDEVTRLVWQFGSIRNMSITYRNSMPLDDEIGRLLMSMYQTNSLTKRADGGKSPMFWNLTMPDTFTGTSQRVDIRMGEGINTAHLLYYDLTDFESLRRRAALTPSPDGTQRVAPLFSLSTYQDVAAQLIRAESRNEYDTYLPPATWQTIYSWFDENGNFKMNDKNVQRSFSAFMNVYKPQISNREREFVRELVRRTIKDRHDMSTTSAAFAEQWANFSNDFMLISARGNLSCDGFNAAEKALRMGQYGRERSISDLKVYLGNPMALTLMNATGVDFLLGTQVTHGEYEYITENQYLKNVSFVKDGRQVRTLGGNQEVWFLAGDEGLEEIDGTYRVIEKGGKIYSDESIGEFPNAKGVKDVTENDEDGFYLIDENGNYVSQWFKSGDVIDGRPDWSQFAEKQPDGVFKVFHRKWHFPTPQQATESTQKIVVTRDVDGKITNVEYINDPDITVKYTAQIVEHGENVEGTQELKEGQRIAKRTRLMVDGNKIVHELGKNETLERRNGAIYILENGQVVRRFIKRGNKIAVEDKIVGEDNWDTIQEIEGQSIDTQQDLVEQGREMKMFTTLDVLKQLDAKSREISYIIAKDLSDNPPANEEERRARVDEIRRRHVGQLLTIAERLEYNGDEMRQFANNQFNRAMGLYHEYIDTKRIIDWKSVYSYDVRKGFVFDQQKLQDDIGEKLIKPRRYAYRTWGQLDMSKVIRAWDPRDPRREYKTMTLAQHIFGEQVLNTFRRKDGTIDWEFLNTDPGKTELIKTEMILRMAADEAFTDDMKIQNPRMAFQAKLALREALEQIPASADWGWENFKDTKFTEKMFHHRKISFNEKGKGFMELYDEATGNSIKSLMIKEGLGTGTIAFGQGVLESFQILFKNAFA